jgi:sulfoquinovosidase
MCDKWNEDGVKPIVYLNPYLADLSELGIDNDLFAYGV